MIILNKYFSIFLTSHFEYAIMPCSDIFLNYNTKQNKIDDKNKSRMGRVGDCGSAPHN